MKKRIFSMVLAVILTMSANTLCFAKSYSMGEVQSVIEGIINWKKIDNGSTPDGYLINNNFLEYAGTTPGDWYPIGLGRYGYNDDYAAYLAVIKENITKRYATRDKLSAAKATEWHRIALAVLAMGGDPTSIGTDVNGNAVNLIADGVYNRGKTASLGKQGINGWIWGLIALDSMRYPVPDGASYTRDDIIVEILRQQLNDGGFALTGNKSDPDMSAMAVQALAPYYNSETVYTYTQAKTKTKVQKTVRQVIDETIYTLSALQADDGDYYSWGTPNAESTAQVLVALCALGINPLRDDRFIKNGNTLLDGIMKYKMADGGFVHSFVYDANNPSSSPDKSNTMATEQVLYTLVAYYRQQNNMRTLYDFRPEMSSKVKSRINVLKSDIDNMGSNPSKSKAEKLMAEYESIPHEERCYVSNYYKLSNAYKTAHGENVAVAEKHNVSPDTQRSSQKFDADAAFDTGEGEKNYVKQETADAAAEAVADENAAVTETEKIYFTDEDKAAVKSLPDVLTTENYVDVVKLLDKLQNSEDFEGKQEYLDILNNAKAKILEIQAEIDSINADVLEKLYPFDKISLKDRKTVHEIVDRYNALSDYDKQKILHYDDIIKTMTQVDNLYRALIISIAVFVIAVGLTVVIIIRVRKRRKKKMYEMMMADESEYDNL